VTSLSVKIRLARHGAKKSPFYRVVVADERSRRDGRYIELVGRYDPRTNPSTVDLDLARIDEWLAQGACPTEAAEKLIAIARGDKEAPVKEAKPSKRSLAKAEAEAAEGAEASASATEAVADSDEATEAVVEDAIEDATPAEEVAEEAPTEEVIEEAVAPDEEEVPEEAPVVEEVETEEVIEEVAE